MPGRQRTFELVPTTLVQSKGPVRPMTSKAAKKAHQQATKGPRISRAEQRRIELEEQERLRKEYERERAAAKAKAAREKKAEKAAVEKAARKKAGLPEPSKFVRPSQPTISMFVKSGTKRSWKEMDSVVEDTDDAFEDIVGDREDDVEPPAKRVAIDDADTLHDLVRQRGIETGSPADRTIVDNTDHKFDNMARVQGNEAEPCANRVPINDTDDKSDNVARVQEDKANPFDSIDDSEDEFGDFPSLSQSDILEKLVSSTAPISKGECIFAETGSPAKYPSVSQDFAPVASQELPRLKSIEDDEFSFEDDEILAEMVNTQLMSEAVEAANKSGSPHVADKPHISPVLPKNPTKDSRKHVDQPRSGAAESAEKPDIAQLPEKIHTPSAIPNASINYPPKPINQQKVSPIPPKGPIKNSQSVNQQTHATRGIYGHKVSQDYSISHDGAVNQNHTIRQNHTVHQDHTINKDHVVSQNHNVAQGHTVNQSHTFNRAPRPPKSDFKNRSALQERSNNIPKSPPNKMKSISFAPTPTKPLRPSREGAKPTLKSQMLPALPPSGTQAFLDSHFDDFFPSLSQQLRELDDDINELPSNTQIARELISDLDNVKPVEAEMNMGMFMYTQDLMLSSQDLLDITTPSRAASKRAKASTCSGTKKHCFVEEKEDIIHTAIHESKIMTTVQQQQKKIPLNDSFSTDYGDDGFGEELFQQKVTVNDSSGKATSRESTRRMLQRVHSVVTDYGDDDFSECSPELLAALDGAEMSGSRNLLFVEG